MNKGFYKDLDTNFEQAYEMAQCDFSHAELINMLKNGNIPQKQIAAMKLEGVNGINEAEILIGNLTGCDGKIREAVALKIYQLLKSDKKFITLFKPFYPKFADGTIDINGNICRLVIDSVEILKEDGEFAEKYLELLLGHIKEAFEGLDKIIFRDKKYTVNKQLFKLYWCLESLRLFTSDISAETLLPILERSSEEKEYTIREKVAQILIRTNDKIFAPLAEKLKNDENYYVRNVFKQN